MDIEAMRTNFCRNREAQGNAIEELRAANERRAIAFKLAEERANGRIEALLADRITALREALAEQVEACFCPDCEMCFRHEQLLKETER